MSVHYVEHPAEGFVEVVIDGAVTKADMDAVFPKLQAFIDAHESTGILEVVHDLGFVNLPAALPHMGFGIANMARIRRAAVVTDLAWLGPFTRAAALVSPIEMKVFDRSGMDAARAWIAAPTGR